jgi:hypothetical protein
VKAFLSIFQAPKAIRFLAAVFFQRKSSGHKPPPLLGAERPKLRDDVASQTFSLRVAPQKFGPKLFRKWRMLYTPSEITSLATLE